MLTGAGSPAPIPSWVVGTVLAGTVDRPVRHRHRPHGVLESSRLAGWSSAWLRLEPPGAEIGIERFPDLFGGSGDVEVRGHHVRIFLEATDDGPDDTRILRDRYFEAFWYGTDPHRRELVLADDATRELLCAHGPTVPRVQGNLSTRLTERGGRRLTAFAQLP